MIMATPGFADWLRSLMADKGWSNADLSRHARVSASSITGYMMGTQPRMDSVVRIARAAGIPEAQALEAAGYEAGEAARDAATIIPEIIQLLEGLELDDQREHALPALELVARLLRRRGEPAQ